jgi:hypothetical protein
MLDLWMILGILVFFALTIALVFGIDRIKE